jgi:hypothetical protein
MHYQYLLINYKVQIGGKKQRSSKDDKQDETTNMRV